MVVATRTPLTFVFVTCLSLTGCLVSFNDYPLSGSGGSSGVSGSGGAGVTAGGTDAGGTAVVDLGGGGSAAGDSAMASSGTAGSSSAGAATAGSSTGGSPAGGSAAGGSPDGGMPQGGASGAPQGGAGGGVTQQSDLLIDDFEDGDSQITIVAGRNGAWFAANDGTFQGQQSPDPRMATLPSLLVPARGASTRALHTTGSGFNDWGAMVGANFLVMGTTVMPYSISGHQGLSFTAKLGKLTAAKQVRVSIRNYDTLYGCGICGDHFGANATLSDTFQTIQIPFSSFKQVGWGKPQVAAFDTTRTYAVTFVWSAHQTFDAWIDDLSFY